MSNMKKSISIRANLIMNYKNEIGKQTKRIVAYATSSGKFSSMNCSKSCNQ